MATFTTLEQLTTVAQAICSKSDLRFRKLADAIAEEDLASALATKINGKADASDLATVSGKVTTLIGNVSGDDAKSVRSIAAEEVANVVADAPASFDTLKEIADWISSHSDDAAAMNTAILALQAKTVLGTYDDQGTTTEYATVKDYVEAYVAEQQSAAALTAGNGIDITSGVVSGVVDTTYANGLSVGANGFALAAATTATAGAMSAADKAKLDDADVTAYTGTGAISVSSHVISVAAAAASTSGVGGNDGTMSAADKEKLDGIVEATSSQIQTLVNGLFPAA